MPLPRVLQPAQALLCRVGLWPLLGSLALLLGVVVGVGVWVGLAISAPPALASQRAHLALVAGLGVSVLGALLLYPAVGLLSHWQQAQEQQGRDAALDALTGVYNRRHFMLVAEREWARARRYATDSAMLLMDVDHFKRVNEAHGRACGDRLLQQIARLSQDTLRQADVMARFDGQAFIVFLPQTDPLGALDVAERIRERIERQVFEGAGRTLLVSVSLGVASLQQEHHQLDQLLHDAEEALRSAKAAGRNCVRAKAGLQPGRPSVVNR